MSECVVRMEMPENCTCCPMCFTADVQGYHWCAALEQEVEQGLSRPKECPIICSLPKGHGRLIDADALRADYFVTSTTTNNPLYRYVSMEQIANAPTVEPASPWHRVEEKPKEGTWCVIAKHSYLQPHNLFYDIAHYLHGIFSVYDSAVGDWFDGKPLYWMPIEPPKEGN